MSNPYPPVVLIGYPGSQKIKAASQYLIDKYLPMFNVTFLNYKGDIKGWSEYLAGYLRYLTDESVTVSLDDYLISDYINIDGFIKAEKCLGGSIACVKLCQSTIEEHLEYPATTQYCIWDRKYLISLLDRVYTPWEFETQGSRIFEQERTCVHRPCIKYFTNSSLSSRWEGVRLDGLKEEDIKHIKENGLIS